MRTKIKRKKIALLLAGGETKDVCRDHWLEISEIIAQIKRE